MSEIKLTDKQEMFCREYIIDFNATQAAIRAGYSESTARQIGAENLSKVDIQVRVKELIEDRNSRVQIDADYVLRQAVKLHERCMQEVSPKIVRGNQALDKEGNNIFIFDSMGAAKSLELIGKHVNVKAFEEKANINNNTITSINIVPMQDAKKKFASNESEIDE